MRYFATASGPRVREVMRTGRLGQIITPATGNRLVPAAAWCADNACYTGHYPGDDPYLRWLARHTSDVSRCAFAVAPDVVGDPTGTWLRSEPMLERIRGLGYPVALVAQDGLEPSTLDWGRFDVLFLGGSTAWKLGPAAAHLAHQARVRGLGVHMGRVNSQRRLRYAASIGCSSSDGTFLAYGPDRNLPRLLAWLSPGQSPPTDRLPPSRATTTYLTGQACSHAGN